MYYVYLHTYMDVVAPLAHRLDAPEIARGRSLRGVVQLVQATGGEVVATCFQLKGFHPIWLVSS